MKFDFELTEAEEEANKVEMENKLDFKNDENFREENIYNLNPEEELLNINEVKNNE